MQECLWGPARVLVGSDALILAFGFLRVIIGCDEALVLCVPERAGSMLGATPYSNNDVIRDLVSRLRISSHYPE